MRMTRRFISPLTLSSLIFFLACILVQQAIQAQTASTSAPVRRFGHFTEIGALATTQTSPDNVTTAAFSFQMVNGYRFSRRLFTGIGVGADLFATETILPVFGSVRGDILTKGDFIPFYFADLGYGFNSTRNETINYRGGLAAALGIGFKVNLVNDKGFLVSFGYRFQQASRTTAGVEENRDYRRLALRAGFYL
jgi:hypothetical protein